MIKKGRGSSVNKGVGKGKQGGPVATIFRRTKHRVRRLHVAALFPLLVTLLVPTLFNIFWYPTRVRAVCPVDTLLVMGAAQYNGTPSPAFKRRLDGALELYQMGCAPRIVVTGGKREGDRTTEGESGARYLQAQGVPEAALASETKSRTSFENLQFSLPLLRGDTGSRDTGSQDTGSQNTVLIVTDDMHAYRSYWLAQHLGLDASVAPVETRGFGLRYALRELTALTAYRLGWLR